MYCCGCVRSEKCQKGQAKMLALWSSLLLRVLGGELLWEPKKEWQLPWGCVSMLLSVLRGAIPHWIQRLGFKNIMFIVSHLTALGSINVKQPKSIMLLSVALIPFEHWANARDTRIFFNCSLYSSFLLLCNLPALSITVTYRLTQKLCMSHKVKIHTAKFIHCLNIWVLYSDIFFPLKT